MTADQTVTKTGWRSLREMHEHYLAQPFYEEGKSANELIGSYAALRQTMSASRPDLCPRSGPRRRRLCAGATREWEAVGFCHRKGRQCRANVVDENNT
jgi:hypothetical protein